MVDSEVERGRRPLRRGLMSIPKLDISKMDRSRMDISISDSPTVRPRLTVLAILLVIAACGDSSGPAAPGTDPPITPPSPNEQCVIDGDTPRSGAAAKDGIPALTNPGMVSSQSPFAAYLEPTDRVIGLNHDGEWLAVPLNIMWWHEIINLEGVDSPDLAITYCPLTGTSIVFDRVAAGGAELGVSGLLWRNNLVMYDRNTNESLWPQMRSRSDCGPARGTVLPQLPATEMTWAAWQLLHPETRVVSNQTGHTRNYGENPYLDYERLDAPPLFDVQSDPRRQPKERVLGIPWPSGNGSTAVPFGALSGQAQRVIALDLPGDVISAGDVPIVVFWDEAMQSAEAYLARPQWNLDPAPTDGTVSFTVVDGRFVDDITGSTWRMDGVAIDGPAAGSRLTEMKGSMTAFWFAWAAVNKNVTVATGF